MMDVSVVLTQMAATEESGVGVVGIDLIAILIQATTFIILFFIVKNFALEKIVKSLQDRKDKIDESLKNAEQIEKVQADTEQKVAALLKDARGQSDQIIADANTEAGAIVNKAEEEANKKADQIIADAQNKLDGDMQKARNELKKEVLDLVVAATETVLEEKADSVSDKRLIEKAIAEAKA